MKLVQYNVQWIYYHYCGYWWFGGLSTRAPAATMLNTQPCVSGYLGVNQLLCNQYRVITRRDIWSAKYINPAVVQGRP